MVTGHAPATKAGKGLPDKHRAILRGALTVFARDGYSRASMDAIAAEARVSTRTIYNHFGDKADLFQAVIQDSASQVADAQIAVIDRYLTKVTDIEADLTEFARVWATPMPEYIDHFAMVRQINAEAGHIPQAALDIWQETGPRRVHRELARHIQRLAGQGLLRVADSDLAATHLVLLTASEVANRSYHGAIPLPETEITRIADAGVHAFLHGYLP
ncbi:MAG TPA: TetR/AcrR family transcriptional regulator [Streptosporangiaceae bacterium]|jgi:AcrR family transcriptional regulator|nr:TetR/AcrR family transcriptional regulator [Streptosporangiaceae bacterium]